jgi:hypothetical protein
MIVGAGSSVVAVAASAPTVAARTTIAIPAMKVRATRGRRCRGGGGAEEPEVVVPIVVLASGLAVRVMVPLPRDVLSIVPETVQENVRAF